MNRQWNRVLVTGGAGFIGHYVVRELLARDIPVRVFDATLASHDSPGRVEWVSGDIRRPAEVEQAVADCDAVIHLAALAHLWSADRSLFESVNHQGTRHLLAAAEKQRVRRFVHVSSETVLVPARDCPITENTRTRLKDQIGIYARSKWRAEQAAWEAAKRGAPVTVATPSVPVGPGDRRGLPMTRLIESFLARPMSGYMRGIMHLMDVRDVAEGLVRILERGRTGMRCLLTAEAWTVGEVLGYLAALTGQPRPRFRVPYPVGLGFAAWEQVRARYFGSRPPLATVSGVRLAYRAGLIDASWTLRELELEPRPVADALERTVAWLQADCEEQKASILDGFDLVHKVTGDQP